jgi:hypothetical protein
MHTCPFVHTYAHTNVLAMPACVLLELKRSNEHWKRVLMTHPLLDEARAQMNAAGRLCFIAHGAKMFLDAEDMHDILFAISRRPVCFDDGDMVGWDDLRPRHVLLSPRYEPVFMQVLKDAPGSGLEGGKHNDGCVPRRRVLFVC